MKEFQRFGIKKIFGEFLFPLLLIVTIPVASTLLWYICRYNKGSLADFLVNLSVKNVLYDMMFNQWSGDLFPIYVITGYFAWAITLTLLLPGKMYKGPLTNKGNTPVYKDNGMLFFVITLITFGLLSALLEYLGCSVTAICDEFGAFLIIMNLGSLLFCLFLYIKGIWFPSSSDNGSSGNPVMDYYWGTELYPRIGSLDLKLLTNCRWGMMVWCLVVILFWLKSLKTFGFVDSHLITVLLITCYLGKFFHWEAGYMKTIDISVDRAGFYLCYGCLCFVPAFYTLPSIYLAYHPVHLGLPLSILICALGFACLYVNYDADRQRYLVRATNGECLIWGKKPTIIRAKYMTLDGTQAENILLASGYWGISRHFHYIPELGLAFCWSTTAMFTGLIPYMYFIFLVCLLTHRSIRDDDKCFNKYGSYWIEYRKLVPYKIVPKLF